MAHAECLQTFTSKRRVFILSDISNEPDDAESLVRYLLYSNQFQTEGLVACTSTWRKTKVVSNLNAHAHPQDPYPTAEYMRSLIKKGAETYGMSAVGDNIPLSEGGQLLLERIEAASPEPLWILCWGGTNVLASVLLKIQNTKSKEIAAALRSKIRVYTISDQDDTGVWIRNRYPDLFYICSVHGWNQYGMAAWSGILGDAWYGFDKGGPDPSKINKEWIRENIQIGPLGSTYPDYMFIPEGDTPTFLYLIQNGLGAPEHPEWGSWGGRYIATDISAKGLPNGHYSDTVDEVVGLDRRTHKSNHATIWRWLDALSPDFNTANHQPVIILNDTRALGPLHLELEAGSTFELDASETYDPDRNDSLTFKRYQYKDPSATQWSIHHEVGQLKFESLSLTGSKVRVTVPPPEKCCLELISRQALARGQLLHIILETLNEKLLGGGGGGAEAIGDVMRDMI
ncbi:hypothetical protein BDV26DRAFT_301777 [Aspergillus bertholletiae]|uniref:Cellulose-binding protein n=1 Tax=Aspergillus bertholletiae TaxID=1226010 RepID=A0A5N7BHW1_9EURO|nr:hypothetical protein BDV26DRAFT_301777 [Aspergillus bertholletiae]